MSMPKNLLKQFEEILKEKGYQSRSKGIKNALEDYITNYKKISVLKDDQFGILTVIYDKNYKGVADDLNDVREEFQRYIKAIMLIQMSKHYFQEVIVINGDAKHIINLLAGIMSLNGVEHVKLLILNSSFDY